MKTITTIKDIRKEIAQAHLAGLRVGLVPTMGYLHEGHLSLIRRAKNGCDFVVVSIFVNPTQFGEGEDYDKYPRDIIRDEELCRNEKVDLVFQPSESEMYNDNCTVHVDEDDISQTLCGSFRPGHFRGVLTVVAKLFNIIQPDAAVFGQKDAQQARLIEEMVGGLNIPVEIIIAPIVRESDGLAMSSRNAYLSEDERKEALCLSQSLKVAEQLYGDGERDSETIKSKIKEVISSVAPRADVDYVDIVNYSTFKPAVTMAGEILIALAVRVGATRLIDNIILKG
jgi:pantoate--beta-alanine ligase